jgi:hypothetical protein
MVHLPSARFKPFYAQVPLNETEMDRFFKDVRTIERMKQGPMGRYLRLYADQLRITAPAAGRTAQADSPPPDR